MPADAEAEGLLQETRQDPELQATEPRTSSEQRTSSSSSSGLTVRAAGKAALVLTGVGCVALAGVRWTKPAIVPDFEIFARAPTLISLEAAMANDASVSQCTDTPHWTNGFFKCKSEGSGTVGCTGNGFTCEAYVRNGWCFGGAPVAGKHWALGESLNFPELNCCACGGGSGSIASSAGASVATLATVPPVSKALEPSTTTTAPRPKPRTCAAYSSCPQTDGACCPQDNGVFMSCCDSHLQCFDTPNWANGYVKCEDYGYTAGQGCTDGGVSCEGYRNQSFCADGAVVKGKEWTLGGRFNHPELNCCVCGKSVDGDMSNGVF